MLSSQEIQRYALFGGLEADQIERVLPLMKKETYENGAEIIVEGTPNDTIRFILEGRVAVAKKGMILTEFKAGDAFGEMEVLDIMPSAASINAISNVTVMSISNQALHEIYKTDTKTFAIIVMNLARDISRRLRALNDRIVEIG